MAGTPAPIACGGDASCATARRRPLVLDVARPRGILDSSDLVLTDAVVISARPATAGTAVEGVGQRKREHRCREASSSKR
jgi:hypothetical protein